MSDFTLKDGIGVSYDKEKFSFTFQNVNVQKGRKVTSRAFPCLLGKNKHESSGKTTLERFGLIEKEQIDPYWLVRGNLAEKIAYDFIKNHYKTKFGVDLALTTWKMEEIAYDNFPKNDKFGGMIDIAISQPTEYRAVVEVKSKSMKDYDSIKESKGNEEEVLQGVFLAYLSKSEKCLMVYVFFTPEQEKQIKHSMETDTKIPIDFTEVKIQVFKHMVADYNLPTLTNVAYQNLDLFKNTKTIASAYFSQEENNYLQKLSGNEIIITDDDLPF
jgi:hypothetical protein